MKLLVLFLLFIFIAWFYWFQFRPSQVKSLCSSEAREITHEVSVSKDFQYVRSEQKITFLQKAYDLAYERCLNSNGL